MKTNLLVIASLLIILPYTVVSVCKKNDNYELRLSVEGSRNLTGQWEKDAKLDFDGPEAPKSWSIDLEEKSTKADRFSFTAVARVLGYGNAPEAAPEPLHVYRGDMRNFTEAQQECKDIGANLAIINSVEEAAYLSTLVLRSRDSRSTNNFTYLGFHDNEREGYFITLQGTPLNETGYYHWAPNEPNNLRFKLPNNTMATENCGSMNLKGLLNDSACHVRLPYICEYEDPCQLNDEKNT